MGVRSLSEPNLLHEDLLGKTCGGSVRHKPKLLKKQKRGKKHSMGVGMICTHRDVFKAMLIRL
jgi:translation elongation factor EF-4